MPAIPLRLRVVAELATAEEIDTGLVRVVSLLRHGCGATRVEWWSAGNDRERRLLAADGSGDGQRRRFPLGPAGEVIVVGGSCDPHLRSALTGAAAIVRRRRAEERLMRAAMNLARRNQALEEFATLVAHELKTPLQAALIADRASSEIEHAIDLVDALLEAARDSTDRPLASAAECLEQAVDDLGPTAVRITAELTTVLPLPPTSLRVILRNLLRNAVAADARRVHVAGDSSQLFVDDDGIGFATGDGYATGSGLGLKLCRRIAARYGGSLELAARPAGGTRATLRLAGMP